MKRRWLTLLGTALVAAATIGSPVHAQRYRQEESQQAKKSKPIGQYVLLVFLLAVPIGLVCRSSRRMM